MVRGQLGHLPEEFFCEAFLRMTVLWAITIALAWLSNKTLKISFSGYLISSRIILDLNDSWPEKMKRFCTCLIEFINMNCNKCFLDFVKPALLPWSYDSVQLPTTIHRHGLTLSSGTMLASINHQSNSL